MLDVKRKNPTSDHLIESKKTKGNNDPVSKTNKNGLYKCNNCKNIILGPNAESVFEVHAKKCFSKSGSDIFECSICFKKFAQKARLNNHLRTIHLVFD